MKNERNELFELIDDLQQHHACTSSYRKYFAAVHLRNLHAVVLSDYHCSPQLY